jgi:ADP-ribosylglycohydrolase
MPSHSRIAGCLFGLALGDALAAPVEFIHSAEEITRRFPPNGPTEPLGDPARVTDDTQMALAVGEALTATVQPYTAATVEGPLRRAFIDWYRSPENDRAPGMTCLRACEELERGKPWSVAAVAGSKGCGANMRVAPVGLVPIAGNEFTETTRAAIAQFQAALTHGHPTALAASDLTARAIADLASGGEIASVATRLRSYAISQRTIYHTHWLGNLWQRPGVPSPEEFIARGWDECLAILDRLDVALAADDRTTDPCHYTGEGWVAEEAFATGLLCFLLHPDDPVAALQRAAVTAGDSDSIACLTGAFAEASHGLAVWPEVWIDRIEYRDRLSSVAAKLAGEDHG